MKKGKMFLASLCAGALLLSAAPSFAEKNEKKEQKLVLEMPRVLDYEQKIGRIANYVEVMDKISVLSLNIPNTDYGLRTVVLEYESESRDFLVMVYGIGTTPLFSTPEFVMCDNKPNKYGDVDGVYKNSEVDGKYEQATLTEEEKEKFNDMYLKIIDKFYSENEEKMAEIEKALEQETSMEELLKILKKK